MSRGVTRGFNDGREGEIELMRLVGSGTFGGWFRSCLEACVVVMGSYHVCKRAIFEHFQVSICRLLARFRAQKNGSTADCSQEVDTGELCTTYVGSKHCCNIRASRAYQGCAPVP